MANRLKAGQETFRFPIEGKMTSVVAKELHGAIHSLVGCFQVIEIDVSKVSEIDLAGLQLMMDAKLKAVALDRSLRFVGHSNPVIRILESYGLSDFFDIAPYPGQENNLVEHAAIRHDYVQE